MLKKYGFNISYIYWGIFILYCFFTLYTIESYQLPWGDEAYFVDISLNYHKTGKLITSLPYPDSPDIPKEDKLYGPLYFWSNAKLFSLFGLHPWTGRLLNLIFGLFNILVTMLMLRKLNIHGNYILLFLLFIVTDVNYNFILHSGRMDLCALAFINLAVYIYFFYTFNSFAKYILVGILIGVGALFTSRLFLMLPLLIFYPLFEKSFQSKRNTFINLSFVLLGLISIYSIWVYYAFGGYGNFINYFLNNQSTSPESSRTATQVFLLNGSLFNRLFRNSYTYIPRYLLFYCVVLYFFISRKVHKEGLIIFISLISISFIFLALESASEAYIAMVKPFIYLIIVFTLPVLFNQIKSKPIFKYLLTGLIIVVFSIQTLFSLQKIMKVIVTKNELRNGYTDRRIAKIIPENSVVEAGTRYFYDCKKNECTYILENWPYNNLKPDYIITKDPDFRDSEYIFIDDLDYDKWRIKSKFSLLQKAYDFTSKQNSYSTNAYIFKRKI